MPSKLILFTETGLVQPFLLTRQPSLGVGVSRPALSDHREQVDWQHTYFLVLVRCFSEEKVWSAVSVIVLAPLSIALAPPSIALVLPSIQLKNKKKNFKVIQLNRVSLIYKQMAAVNFPHFYFVKLFVKMDRKVTSNIKFKKFKIVNKRITYNLCTFSTFQTVINISRNIRIFDAGICFA